MTDRSGWSDNEINEAIFEAKGWVKSYQVLGGMTKAYSWLNPNCPNRYFAHAANCPDYTHSWDLCGELLEEMDCSLTRIGRKWCVSWLIPYTDEYGIEKRKPLSVLTDTPQRAICEAWLAWKEQG